MAAQVVEGLQPMADQRRTRGKGLRTAEKPLCSAPNPVPLAAALKGLSVTHSKNMGGGEVSGVK